MNDLDGQVNMANVISTYTGRGSECHRDGQI